MSDIEPRGAFYRAQVPDTIDLADHARAALNALMGNLDPQRYYGVYQDFSYGGRPRYRGLTWNLPAKNARAVPWLRTMCGSCEHLDVEENLMNTLADQIEPRTGLCHVPIDNDGAPKDTAYPYANGLLALAARTWYDRDANQRWRDVADGISAGLARCAITVADRAYYPPECGYSRSGSWQWTARGTATIPYRPPDEPITEQQGLEGCVKYEQSAALRALIATGTATDVQQKLIRFLSKPTLWEESEDSAGAPGHEHGIFAGHFHGNITTLHALLDYAVATRDARLGRIVREGYDYARRTGLARMGWFPGWLRPEAHNRPAELFLASETCGVSDMLVLAVKLSDAGLGDYWDDVDAIARNHLVAQQAADVAEMRQYAEPGNDATLSRFAGGFGQSMNGWINSTAPRTFGCCTANGAIGLYYAWHSIIRFAHGTAMVNLLLNRASIWMDVDSYLPYTGEVVLHNKLADRVLIRVPSWAGAAEPFVEHNGRRAPTNLLGRYVVVENLRPGDLIRMRFPIAEDTETHTVAGRRYRVRYRAGTALDVRPRIADPGMRQFYQRGHLACSGAPMRTVDRFVSDRVLALQ